MSIWIAGEVGKIRYTRTRWTARTRGALAFLLRGSLLVEHLSEWFTAAASVLFREYFQLQPGFAENGI